MIGALIQVVAPRGSRRRRWYDERRAPSRSSAAPGVGRDAPTILVLDYWEPRPSIDAGSVRMDAILRAVEECGYQTLLYATDDDGSPEGRLPRDAVPWYRLDHPAALREVLRDRSQRIDAVWICHPDVAGAYWRDIARHRPAAWIVYDTIDLHGARLRSKAALTGRLEDRLRAAYLGRLEERALRDADVVIAITDIEAAAIHEIAPGADVVVVPMIHDVRTGAAPPHGERTGALFVGGFAHGPNVDAATWIVDELAPGLAVAAPGLGIDIIGRGAPADLVERAPSNVRFAGYVPDLTEWYDRVLVALAPLRFGAGMKGKVGEAMANGVPVVATTVAAEGFGAAPGVDLLLADDADEFVALVVTLVADGELWARVAASGQELVRTRFGIEAGRERVSDVLTRISRGGPPGRAGRATRS